MSALSSTVDNGQKSDGVRALGSECSGVWDSRPGVVHIPGKSGIGDVYCARCGFRSLRAIPQYQSANAEESQPTSDKSEERQKEEGK
jgi:hypothetical protein